MPRKKTETAAADVKPAEAKPVEPNQLIDTKKLTEGLVSFYEGVANVMDTLCKAADGMNELYGKLNGLCSDLKYAACRDVPSAFDQDYCIPDEVEEMKQEKAEKTEPANQADEEKPAPVPESIKDYAVSAEPEIPAEPAKPAAPTISQDDLTKIITTKLRKDKSNADKILALLKSYNCSKVSELPPEKYEAFVTDISQL